MGFDLKYRRYAGSTSEFILSPAGLLLLHFKRKIGDPILSEYVSAMRKKYFYQVG